VFPVLRASLRSFKLNLIGIPLFIFTIPF
jgi:hypothetical protein